MRVNTMVKVKLSFLLILLVGCTRGGTIQPDDFSILQGTWVYTATNGSKIKYLIQGDKISSFDETSKQNVPLGQLFINQRVSPCKFDACDNNIVSDGSDKVRDGVMIGIYELNGDVLRLAFADVAGELRPKKLTPDNTWVFVRIK